MATHTLYDKTLLCYTEPEDFTDIQGIGRNPLYKRFDSVYSVIEKHIPQDYRDFLAHPLYSEDDGYIRWYVKNWVEYPCKFVELSGEEKAKYAAIKDRFIATYTKTADSLTGEDAHILKSAIKYIDDEFIFCYDNKVSVIAWGMTLDGRKHIVKGRVIHDLKIHTRHRLSFNAEPHGVLRNRYEDIITKIEGTLISSTDLPEVIADSGYIFKGWTPDPVGLKVDQDMMFNAVYEEVKEEVVVSGPVPLPFVTCTFDAGEFGTLEGQNVFSLQYGSSFNPAFAPKVVAAKGHRFIGWDKSFDQFTATDNVVFTALYEEDLPWYKRFWHWILASVLLKWLFWILLFLLLLLLSFFMFRSCVPSIFSLFDCYDWSSIIVGPGGTDSADQVWIDTDPNVRSGGEDAGGGIYNPVNPYRPDPTPDDYSDILPPHQGVLPPLDDNPELVPGNPGIIANRLNILMENTDKSIMDLAKAFKEQYPDDKYQVIYYDDVVKRMQITFPEEERETLKAEIPEKFKPDYQLFVFDEALFEGVRTPSDPAFSDFSKTWYLDAVNAFEGWDITMGTDSVVIAVVDNGFNLRHPELKDKYIRPYNVWEHNDNVYAHDVDHGTHVAGIAVASADNGKGLCGIAPKCRFIPVQIADKNDMMTTTSVLDGVLYAMYQGADVLNISLGQQCSAISHLDERSQQLLIGSTFKEEERLWREISRIAASHKTTVVIAAGNDGVLAGIDPLHRPDNFIVVSAVDKNLNHLQRANFSNYGAYSTISAPGVEIYSSMGDDYASYDGTSMAAPIVTGAVALMKSLDKSLTSSQITTIMQSTGLPVYGNVGKLLQIDRALKKVMSGDYADETSTPIPSSGDVEISLSWDNYNDLDLMCTDPNGEMIWFNNKTARSGGKLEIDMNVEYPGSTRPIEHIFWPSGQAVEGTYNVYVKYFRHYGQANGSSPYSVKVKYNSQVEQYEGILEKVGDVVQICSFTIGNPTSNPYRQPAPPSSSDPSSPQDSDRTDSADKTDRSSGDTPQDDNVRDDARTRLENERDRLRNELERVENELARIKNLR